MAKQHLIEQYVNDHIGSTMSTTTLASEVGCTLPTVLTFIKNNPHRFNKVSRGNYQFIALQEADIEQHADVPEQAQYAAVVSYTAVGAPLLTISNISHDDDSQPVVGSNSGMCVLINDEENASVNAMKLPEHEW